MTPNTRTLKGQSYRTKRWANLAWPKGSKLSGFSTFTATSKESVRKVVSQIKDDCLELYSYELKDRRTSQGEVFEASIEMKVKRGNHNERLINYMDEFDDVTISSIE